MKYGVYIWVTGTEEEEEPLQSYAVINADNSIQAVKKMIADIDERCKEVEMVRWIEQAGGDFWECSNCKLGWFFDSGTPEENDLNYCPKCGCRVTGFVREVKDNGSMRDLLG